MKKYDVIIVGAGPMGIYTAYELMKKSPDKKVLLVDKGHDIYHRNCPILKKQNKTMSTRYIWKSWMLSSLFND